MIETGIGAVAFTVEGRDGLHFEIPVAQSENQSISTRMTTMTPSPCWHVSSAVQSPRKNVPILLQTHSGFFLLLQRDCVSLDSEALCAAQKVVSSETPTQIQGSRFSGQASQEFKSHRIFRSISGRGKAAYRTFSPRHQYCSMFSDKSGPSVVHDQCSDHRRSKGTTSIA
jgi:hypothetical protein